MRQRAFVIQNLYVIPRVEIAAANIASERMFDLMNATPVGALAETPSRVASFIDRHDRRLG
jgi:hypothetical protein